MPIFRTVLMCLLPIIPLWIYAIWIVSFGHDDSHITFWAAQSLAETGEILNYNGERIEQSSSLLFTVLLAAANILGINIVTAGYISGFVAAHLVVWGTVAWLKKEQCSAVLALLAGLGVACSPYFAAWSLSGMESCVAALCAMLYLYCCHLIYKNSNRRLVWALWLIAAAALAAVRPEMPIVLALHAIVTAAYMRQIKWLVPLAAIALLILWRISYFEQVFPNPVYAKAGTQWLDQLFAGITYVMRLNEHWLLALASGLLGVGIIIAIGNSLFAKMKSFPLWLCSLWVIIYAAFVIATGGDWMREGRFWVPLIACSWLCIGLLVSKIKLPPIAIVLMLIPVLLLSGYSARFLNKFNAGIPIWQHEQISVFANPDASLFEIHNREHLRDWPAIRTLQQILRELPAEQTVTLMSKQMGMVVFHLKQEFPNLRVIDAAGLVENSMRGCIPLRVLAGFDWQGLRLSYPLYFMALNTDQVCQQAGPDIIYDLYGWGKEQPLPEVLIDNGYFPVFIQQGNLEISGPVRSATEVVAVKNTLASTLKLTQAVGPFAQFSYPKPLVTEK